jgi:hypothetical protein
MRSSKSVTALLLSASVSVRNVVSFGYTHFFETRVDRTSQSKKGHNAKKSVLFGDIL